MGSNNNKDWEQTCAAAAIFFRSIKSKMDARLFLPRFLVEKELWKKTYYRRVSRRCRWYSSIRSRQSCRERLDGILDEDSSRSPSYRMLAPEPLSNVIAIAIRFKCNLVQFVCFYLLFQGTKDWRMACGTYWCRNELHRKNRRSLLPPGRKYRVTVAYKLRNIKKAIRHVLRD